MIKPEIIEMERIHTTDFFILPLHLTEVIKISGIVWNFSLKKKKKNDIGGFKNLQTNTLNELKKNYSFLDRWNVPHAKKTIPILKLLFFL